jgi:DNA-binding MarR family transcriptional regulator
MSHPPTLGFLLHDCARLLRKRFEQNARDLGLTRSQWQVLAFLARNEGIHQSGLADLLDIEPITLVRLIDKLESRGLVERRRHEKDRRIWLLFLTEAAHPLLEAMLVIGERTRAEALVGLTGEDRERLLSMLTVMKENLVEALNRPSEAKEVNHG